MILWGTSPILIYLIIVRKGVPVLPIFKSHIAWPSLSSFVKSLCPFPSVLFHPLLGILDSSLTLKQISAALIWPTNLFRFKQISKGQIYQFNCHFLLKISFNLLNPFTSVGYLNWWDIFRLIFKQLRTTFFHKVMVTEKNNFSSNV